MERIQDLILLETNLRYSNRRKTIVLSTSLVIDNITARGNRLNTYQNRPIKNVVVLFAFFMVILKTT